MRDRILRTIIWVLGIVTVLIVLVLIYARTVSTVSPPEVTLLDTAAVVQEPAQGLRRLGNNWFRRSESGLYELYVEGKPFERGLANGKLTRDLVQYQEVAF